MYHHSYASKVVSDRYVSNPSFRLRKGLVRSVIDALTKPNNQK